MLTGMFFHATIRPMNKRYDQTKASLEDWHPADVVASLRKAGWSMRRLAEHHGVAHSNITLSLRRPYPKSDQRIADAIGVSRAVIWPSRYHPDGSRRISGRGCWERVTPPQVSMRPAAPEGKNGIRNTQFRPETAVCNTPPTKERWHE